MNLFKASKQWSTRPADERFWTLDEMHAATRSYADESRDIPMYLKDVTVTPVGDELTVVGRSGIPATLTNYAFGQLASLSSAPAGYLRTLPPELAATCLNASVKASVNGTDERRMLVHVDERLTARCVTSTRYARVWNHELCSSLLSLGTTWRNPPAWGVMVPAGVPTRRATSQDVMPGTSIVQEGDVIAPSGLYASDRDMFAFLVNTKRVIEGSPRGLAIGFFAWNSEVGDSSLGVQTFAFDYVCGNHIVWGAKNVRETRIRHVGNARSRARTIVDVAELADESASDFEAKIKAARSYELGASPQEVVAAVVKAIDVSTRLATEAYVIAASKEDDYGSPRAVWGMVSGLTQIARDLPHADARAKLDAEAGKLLDCF